MTANNDWQEVLSLAQTALETLEGNEDARAQLDRIVKICNRWLD